MENMKNLSQGNQ